MVNTKTTSHVVYTKWTYGTIDTCHNVFLRQNSKQIRTRPTISKKIVLLSGPYYSTVSVFKHQFLMRYVRTTVGLKVIK